MNHPCFDKLLNYSEPTRTLFHAGLLFFEFFEYHGGIEKLKILIEQDKISHSLELTFLDPVDLNFFVDFFESTDKLYHLWIRNFREVTNLPKLTKALVNNIHVKDLKIMKGESGYESYSSYLRDGIGYSTDYMQKSILNLSLMNTIEKLEFESLVFTDDNIKCIALYLSKNTALYSFGFVNNNMDNKQVSILAKGLRANSTIRKLDFSYNIIGDAGVKALANLVGHNSRIRKLNLSNNCVTKDGMEYFLSCLGVNEYLMELNFAVNLVNDNEIPRICKVFDDVMKTNKCLQIFAPTRRYFEAYLTRNKKQSIERFQDLWDAPCVDYRKVKILTCVEFDKKGMKELRNYFSYMNKLTKLTLINCADFPTPTM